LLEEYEKRKVILKVFLLDNFWGEKRGIAGNCKHRKCREFREKRH
jgi:hypothetical protein